MGDQCLLKNKKITYDQNKDCYNFYMLLILIMNKNIPLHPNSSYYQMFLRDKKVILILSCNPNWFLDLKQYHSLEHAETKKYILFRYLRKIYGLVSTTFTLEQKSGLKLARNKDLRFIAIIIDIDIWKKMMMIIFWAISPSPNII